MILGVSLGGCIAVNAIHQTVRTCVIAPGIFYSSLQGDLFKGALLLVPMLSVESIAKKGLNPYIR